MQAVLQPGARPLSKPIKPAAKPGKPTSPAKPSKGSAKAGAPKGAEKPKAKPASKLDPHRILEAEFLAGAGPAGTLPAPVQVELAFAGRSNVGKSSLINTLVSRKGLVRTSSTPGSTRQVNLYQAKAADGAVFHLIDLPGYGFSHRSKAEKASWTRLIEDYLERRVTLAAVVLLVDVRRGLEEDDRELVDFVKSATAVSRRPVEVLVVATKVDKLALNARKVALHALRQAAGVPVLGFSAVSGEGKEQLWKALRRAALGELADTKPVEPAPEAQEGAEAAHQNG